MPRPKKPFPSGNPLPPNVVHHHKLPGHYRIRIGGKLKTLNVTEESEVVACAKQVLDSEGLNFDDPKPKKARLNTLAYYWEKFEEHYWRIKEPTQKNKDALGATKKHIQPLMDTGTKKIKRKDLSNLWFDFSYFTQKNCRPALFELVNFLIDNELSNDLIKYSPNNPFSPVSAGGFKYKKQPEKLRGKLTAELFEKIKAKAEELGYQFLVDAMNISFLTSMRISDVLGLKDQHIKNGELEKIIEKTKGRSLNKMQMNGYNLDEHKELHLIIKKSQLRRRMNCPYIIHHYFKARRKGKTKEYYDQVTSSFLTKCLTECMDSIKETKNIPRKQRPSFHELRHLRLATDINVRPIEDISKDMAHADIKVTQVYNTHADCEKRNVTYVPSLIGRL